MTLLEATPIANQSQCKLVERNYFHVSQYCRRVTMVTTEAGVASLLKQILSVLGMDEQLCHKTRSAV